MHVDEMQRMILLVDFVAQRERNTNVYHLTQLVLEMQVQDIA